jgi:hypothetical protein
MHCHDAVHHGQVRDDLARWAGVVKSANVKLE